MVPQSLLGADKHLTILVVFKKLEDTRGSLFDADGERKKNNKSGKYFAKRTGELGSVRSTSMQEGSICEKRQGGPAMARHEAVGCEVTVACGHMVLGQPDRKVFGKLFAVSSPCPLRRVLICCQFQRTQGGYYEQAGESPS